MRFNLSFCLLPTPLSMPLLAASIPSPLAHWSLILSGVDWMWPFTNAGQYQREHYIPGIFSMFEWLRVVEMRLIMVTLSILFWTFSILVWSTPVFRLSGYSQFLYSFHSWVQSLPWRHPLHIKTGCASTIWQCCNCNTEKEQLVL